MAEFNYLSTIRNRHMNFDVIILCLPNSTTLVLLGEMVLYYYYHSYKQIAGLETHIVFLFGKSANQGLHNKREIMNTKDNYHRTLSSMSLKKTLYDNLYITLWWPLSNQQWQ
uniref:Uncharacterized protein n=1 Tax=Glossina pallidipes TaxID=7398 RepID=A0A1B0AH48_GLOPL